MRKYDTQFSTSSVTDGTTSEGSAGVTNQKPAFKQSIDKSSNSNIGTVTSRPGMLWNYIRQGDASLACQNLYAGNEYNGKSYVESDLVNSYAWDTAIMFIQKCSDKTTYWDDYDGNGTLYNTGEDEGKTTDNPCNIYDMKGNLAEWTTEYSSSSNSNVFYYSCVDRGGLYDDSSYYTADRGSTYATTSNYIIGFRAVLSCSPVS